MQRDTRAGAGPREARKRFGQHFLEPAWVVKVLDAIAPRRDEDFVEIGPGRGALTLPLAARARQVVAFEIDRDLSASLRAAAPPGLTVVEGDFLDVSADRIRELLHATGFPAGPLRVAGNLPYNVASPILFRLTALASGSLPLSDATLMLQREVADRLTAAPGTRTYGVLTILIGRRARAERLLTLPPGAFRPPPKVHSALVRLRFHAPDPPALNEALLATMVQAVFTRRRKTLGNALAAYAPAVAFGPVLALDQAGIDPRRRPETLDASELVRLADVLARGA
ncbi:MAG: 16S rRNA (adenine(1518)-N(6)/adenine(1519)-N(6))-dimethyltransferase RsmA [Betaproteobacteria bacterium]